MKLDPLTILLSKIITLSKEKGILNKEIQDIINIASFETRQEYGNEVRHIQGYPIIRYLVYQEWEDIYKLQFENGYKTKYEIANLIYDNIIDIIERLDPLRNKQNSKITITGVLRLVSDFELSKTKEKIDFLNGFIDDDTLADGYINIHDR